MSSVQLWIEKGRGRRGEGREERGRKGQHELCAVVCHPHRMKRRQQPYRMQMLRFHASRLWYTALVHGKGKL